MKFFTYFAKFTFGFADSLKISFQMCPAYLANQFVKIVGTITVCYKFAAKVAEQFTSGFLAAVSMNDKKCRSTATKSPQPTLFQITSGPTGFVSIGDILFSGMFSYFFMRLCQLFWAASRATWPTTQAA